MTRSAEVVAAVRELSGPGVKQVEIAAKAGCSKSQVSLATSLLTRAPDLAEAASAGRLGLSRASAIARQRQPPAPPYGLPEDAGWLPPVFLTVTEAAAKLSRHRSAVLRMLHAGKLRGVKLGRSYRIPESEVHRVAAGQPRERHDLTVEQCARILRCSPATVYSLLYYGHLVGERNGEQGNYRIPVTEFQRFISNATR
jgi:excisionase family DNA binding protein